MSDPLKIVKWTLIALAIYIGVPMLLIIIGVWIAYG